LETCDTLKTILAIETSCDETAVAILRGNDLLASEVASQTEHEAYGGVVPEVASRNHLLHAPRLLEKAFGVAGLALNEVDAFAATSGPGLASSLMIGASIAKGLALGAGRPYLAVNHLEGHLLSPFFSDSFEIEPNVSLIVSGGHTLLVEVRGINEYRILGRTMDDAAGEAFDKVAKLLGLGYPGGPEIERRAKSGNPARFDFPRSMLDSGDHNFSFSGLKTAVRYRLADLEAERGKPELVDDICASFQRAAVEVLVKKTMRAAAKCRAKLVTMSGGVSCNQALRAEMNAACEPAGVRLLTAAPRLCTDNAAMIAFAASLRLAAGHRSEVTQEIDPNLALV
jgi:N6-L-threonylcarbamoyladenine synthase